MCFKLYEDLIQVAFDLIKFLSGDLICARIASDLVTMQENVPMWLSATTVVFLGKVLLSFPNQAVFHSVFTQVVVDYLWFFTFVLVFEPSLSSFIFGTNTLVGIQSCNDIHVYPFKIFEVSVSYFNKFEISSFFFLQKNYGSFFLENLKNPNHMCPLKQSGANIKLVFSVLE